MNAVPLVGGQGAGWRRINSVPAAWRDGTSTVNAEGAWLHNIASETYVVVPDGFEAFARLDAGEAESAKNRVPRSGRHRERSCFGSGEHILGRPRRRALRREGRSISREAVGGWYGAAATVRRPSVRDGSPNGRDSACRRSVRSRTARPEASALHRSSRARFGVVQVRDCNGSRGGAVQEAYEAVAKGIGISGFALPNDADAPTAGLEVCDVPCVPCLVRVDLVAPVPRAAGGSPPPLARVPVPETAMDENYLTPGREDEIRSPRQVGAVESVTVSDAVEHAPHRHLRPGVLLSHRRHDSRSDFRREVVAHFRTVRRHAAWSNPTGQPLRQVVRRGSLERGSNARSRLQGRRFARWVYGNRSGWGAEDRGCRRSVPGSRCWSGSGALQRAQEA